MSAKEVISRNLIAAEIERYKWYRKDAEERFRLATVMRDWEEAIKFAEQLQALDHSIFDSEFLLELQFGEPTFVIESEQSIRYLYEV